MDQDEKKKQKEAPLHSSSSEGQAKETKEERGVFEEHDEREKHEEHDKHECKCDEYEGKYKRALADYQNLEKRTREERSEWIKSSAKDILLRLLPVLDTLSLANKHIENQGLQVTLQQFLDVLKQEGVIKIETVGKKFDPHLMEAVEQVGEGDEVVEEVREGYLLHDKLLRPAQVRVGKRSE
ncbi:MAG: nucleotide exchange factor GrpE [Candidatus Levybacteria bacterium]|nr:nucleotide exchange factor GrpE [Candidatus Levybacteria bacterium]